MWKNWGSWLKVTIASLAMMVAGAIATYATAYPNIPKPPEPGLAAIFLWAIGGNNFWALIAAIVAGLGFVASLMQLFGPTPLGESLARTLFAQIETRANFRHFKLQRQIQEEAQASASRDQAFAQQMDQLNQTLREVTLIQSRDIEIEIKIKIKQGGVEP